MATKIESPLNSGTWVDFVPPTVVETLLSRYKETNINGTKFQGPFPVPADTSFVKVIVVGNGLPDEVEVEVHGIIEDGKNHKSPLLREGPPQRVGDSKTGRYLVGSAAFVGFTMREAASLGVTVKVEFYKSE